jgi:hypothetical protein
MGLSLHGVRFNLPLTEAIERLVALRPQVKAMQMHLVARFLARTAVEAIDAYVVLGGERHRPATPLSDAWEELRDRRKAQRVDQRRDPLIDTDCDVVLFAQGAHTLAMLIGDLDGVDTLLESAGAVDWSWGRYERPSHLDGAAWSAREADWTAAMGGDAGWIPSRRGVTYSYSDSLLPQPEPDLILASVPTQQARAEHLAKLAIGAQIAANAREDEDVFQLILQSLWDTARIQATATPLLERLPSLTLDVLRSGPTSTL